MIERIELLIAETERFNASSQTIPMMPYILESLKRLLMLYKSDHPDRRFLDDEVYGLGRIVMDDYRFSDGPLGQKLMQLANDIMRDNKKDV
jgi:hypothetical protein